MDDMVNHNNQAGRLHTILTSAKNQPDHIATIEVWANVFNLDQQDVSSIFRKIILLQKMSDDIKNKVLSISGANSKLLLSQHYHIDNVIKAPNLGASWANYKPQLDLAVMLSLAHCAETLSRYDEKPIDENDLKSLNDDIGILFQKVSESDLDPKLREIILDLLEAIRRSIVEYQIRGADGIRDQLAYCYGKVMQNNSIFIKDKNRKEVNLLWEIFARTDNLTTVALNLISLGTTAINLLAICYK